MKAAKLIICCIVTALIIISPVRASANGNFTAAAATSRYARADARDIYFCERKDLNYSLFIIPYTYCVEIISTDGDWYYCKYAEDTALYRAIYGYCLSEHLTPVETPPANIFLNKPVTVKFKTDVPAGSLPVLGELDVTAAFYGTYYAGASAYSYVMYDGTFGYIYGANDDYDLNEIPSDTPPDNEVPVQGGGGNSKLYIGLALAGLAAAALVILYLTGRNRHFRPDR